MIATPTEPRVMTRDEWLDHRKTRIGASEVAAILGRDRYRSAYTLWAEKSGLQPPQNDSRILRVSRRKEAIIADEYALETGRTLYDPGDTTIWTHPDLDYLFCTPDRLVEECGAPVELKNLTSRTAGKYRDGDGEVAHQIQLMIQMACLGAEWGGLCALVDDRDLYHPEFERDDDLIALMLGKVREFHERVLNGDPPDVDNSESTAHTLAVLHPKDDGRTVMISASGYKAGMRHEELKEEIKALEAEDLGCKNALEAEIGDATTGQHDGHSWTHKHQTRKASIKVPLSELGKLEEADIKHAITPESEYRVLRRVGG